MKQNIYLYSIPFFAVTALLLASSSGSPGGKTGSPGDGGATCVQCHTGTANPVNDWITTDIPMTGYVPGTTYTITLTGTHTGVGKFGFELTSEDISNNKVGTFVITDPIQTQLRSGGTSVTHTSAGNTPTGNTKTWTVDWTAPLAGTGDVGFYAAFNAANGNGNTAGDVIYTTSRFIMEEVITPEITGIVPNQANQGQSLTVTISGSGTSWTASSDVSLSSQGIPVVVITATSINAINNQELEAQFDIPSDATAGLWNVNVDELSLMNAFEIMLITGLDDFSFAELNVYPNPSSGILNLTISENAEVRIYDMNGNKVNQLQLVAGNNLIDMRGSTAGMYFLNIIGTDKADQLKVIVK